MTKPVVGYIAGLTAPPGRRMGHAGAIVSAAGDSVGEKVEILRESGVTLAPNAAALGATVAEVLAGARRARTVRI
jgi:malate-CoA ligase subunit alpha